MVGCGCSSFSDPCQRIGEEMSGKLVMSGRPWVIFDAANKQHRKWYAEFQARRSWGRCPVRFIIADDQFDLLTMIQRRLNQYYTSREFGEIRC